MQNLRRPLINVASIWLSELRKNLFFCSFYNQGGRKEPCTGGKTNLIHNSVDWTAPECLSHTLPSPEI